MRRVLYAFDHAVWRQRIDREAGGGLGDGLVMGAVHLHGLRADDGVQHAAGFQRHGMARLGARVGLLVGERVRHRVRDVLDEGAAQRHVHQLLAAADAEGGHRLPVRAAGNGKLEGGAPVLGGDGLVPCRGAEEGRVHVEGAAGDDEAVHGLQVTLSASSGSCGSAIGIPPAAATAVQ